MRIFAATARGEVRRRGGIEVPMAGWKKLCCAIDLSEASRAAMREAMEIARRFDAELELLHVHLDPAMVAPGPDMSVPPPTFLEVATTELRSTVAGWQEEAERALGRAVHATVLPGSAPDEIVRLAREHGSDLLVLGSHGRRGVERFLLGSVAERVVREAPCSVLVVRGRGG
jgi:nucleotide-binding universal stress UspA family protein